MRVIRPPNDLLLTLAAPDPDGRVRVTLRRYHDAAQLAVGETPPGSTKQVIELSAVLQDFPETTVAEAELENFGAALANLALPGSVHDGLRTALTESGDFVSPIRLRLAVSGTENEMLPWEFLHLGAVGSTLSGFLGLHPRLRLVRELSERAKPAVATAITAGPVRVLLAHADPRAPGYPALPHLPAEVNAVRAALAAPECRRVEVHELAAATPASLRRCLREWEPHVLHLIGHGDARPSGGVLVLQGERDGSAAFVYGDELAGWLTGTAAQLVVLSACRTASPVGSVARSLSAAGVPVVVAMQLPLRDVAAALFSRTFYAALLEPCAPEEAVAQARQAVRGIGPDWGVPVLYLAGPLGPLFAAVSSSDGPPLPPTNLPYRPSEAFVGRGGMLAELHRVLHGGRSAALVGMGGLGKTQLAVEYAHARRADYPGGVFWINARDTDALTDDLAVLGRRFFGAPSDLPPAETAAWARDALARRTYPALLVCDEVGAETDLRGLPPTGACRLLLTAREGYRVPPGFRSFLMPVLDDASAAALLGTADGPASEREAASAIARLLGYLPLALALVAHHVGRLNLTLTEYQERLEASPFETLRQARRRFVAATAHDGALYDAFTLSYRSLTSAAAGVLAAAAALGPSQVPPDLLAEVWGAGPPDEFEEAVADLADGALVTRGTNRRLTVHELVRAFVREQIPETGRREQLQRAAAALTRRLSEALDAGTVAEARDEAVHADACAAQCRTLGLEDALLALLLPLGRMAFEAGRFTAARAHYDAGLALLRARGPDGPETAPFLYRRSEVRFPLDERASGLADAWSALQLVRRAWGRNALALEEYYNQVGLSLRYLERFRRARPFYARALVLAEAAHGRRHPHVAHCLNNLGILAEFQGELTESLAFQVEALSIFREFLDPRALYVGVALNNLGRLLSRLARWTEALGHHTEALALYESAFGHQHPGVATSLFYTAEAEEGLGRTGDARRHYEEALSLFEHVYGSTNYRCGIVRERLAAR